MYAICEDVYALALALILWRLWSNMDTADYSILYCIIFVMLKMYMFFYLC